MLRQKWNSSRSSWCDQCSVDRIFDENISFHVRVADRDLAPPQSTGPRGQIRTAPFPNQVIDCLLSAHVLSCERCRTSADWNAVHYINRLTGGRPPNANTLSADLFHPPVMMSGWGSLFVITVRYLRRVLWKDHVSGRSVSDIRKIIISIFNELPNIRKLRISVGWCLLIYFVSFSGATF